MGGVDLPITKTLGFILNEVINAISVGGETPASGTYMRAIGAALLSFSMPLEGGESVPSYGLSIGAGGGVFWGYQQTWHLVDGK